MKEAVLCDNGTVAVDREELTMDVIIGKNRGRHALNKVIGRGSRGQVEVLDKMVILAICSFDGR